MSEKDDQKLRDRIDELRDELQYLMAGTTKEKESGK